MAPTSLANPCLYFCWSVELNDPRDRARWAQRRTGRGLVGAVEEASAAEVEAVFATNVFGTLNVIRAVLPHVRARRAGHVVNITSMGGFAQVPGWGVYGATKFALEGLSEAMRAELSPSGSRSLSWSRAASEPTSSTAAPCTQRPTRPPTMPPRPGRCAARPRPTTTGR